MNQDLYPFQFDPIFINKIWGGEKLKTILNKPINSTTTGESWELSAVEDNVSIISNGIFKGKSITEIIERFPNELLGTTIHDKFGKKFPLLFKFLDAHENLSVQVHPNDELAKKRHHTFGKTEMWYVLQADPESEIIVGFKHTSSPDEYLKSLKDKNILDILNNIKVRAGDVFFLETGTVHGIGAGILIAEIQQTSDITYRIYDYDRIDAEGNKRELHVDLALEAINYKKKDTQQKYTEIVNESNTLVSCPFFTTNLIPLDGEVSLSKNGESFTVFMCADGNFDLQANDKSYNYKKGDTVLLPASIESIKLSGKASILEIYIS